VNATDFSQPIKKLTGMYYEVPEDLKEPSVPETDMADEMTSEQKPPIEFDAILIPDSASKVGLILPQLSFYDVGSIYFIGTNLWHTESLIELAGSHAERSIIPDGFFLQSKRPVVKKFIQQFQETYGETPGFIEAVAYDSAMMIFDTLSQGTIMNTSDLKDRILSTNGFEGVTGITSFDSTGDAIKELYLLRVNNGNFKELE
jgi:ABC-type branched-subunit amino acid transport system substrate-binding protein